MPFDNTTSGIIFNLLYFSFDLYDFNLSFLYLIVKLNVSLNICFPSQLIYKLYGNLALKPFLIANSCAFLYGFTDD